MPKRFLPIASFLALLAAVSVAGEPPKWKAADLAGEWELTLPAGFKSTIKLTALREDKLLIGANGNLAGQYEIKDDLLTIHEPADERFAGMQWQIIGEKEIVLIKAPSAVNVGSNYVGALLKRE